MARQKGLHKIIGTIDDASYIKTKEGFRVKAKSEISKSKFESAPSMVRTRENAAEFGRAGQAGKLLRLAVRSVLKHAKDSRVTGRLTGAMMKVLKADATSDRGLRNVMDGETELLKDFEFNKNAPLSMTFPVVPVTNIDRATGQLTVALPAYVPSEDIVAPEGTTHYKLVSAGTAVDFENKSFVTGESSSGILPWDKTPVPAGTLTTSLPAAGTHPIFLLLGIQFLQIVNGKEYPLKNGIYNALAIADVSGI